MHCTLVNIMFSQHFEVAFWQMFLVAEIEGYGIKGLNGSALLSMNLDGKELMHTCVWMAALVRLLKC